MNKAFLLCLTALTFTQVMLAERALSYPEEKSLISFEVPGAWVA